MLKIMPAFLILVLASLVFGEVIRTSQFITPLLNNERLIDIETQMDTKNLGANAVHISWQGVSCNAQAPPDCRNSWQGHCAKSFKVVRADNPQMTLNRQTVTVKHDFQYDDPSLTDGVDHYWLVFAVCHGN